MADSVVISLANDALNTGLETVSKKLEALGLPPITTVLNEGKINLEKCLVNDVQSQSIPVHCNLAASFGKLNKESVKMMDEKLKVLIAGTVRELQKVPSNNLSWEEVISIFNQNSLMERVGNSEISKTDKLIKDYGTSFFKIDGSPDTSVVKEVESWFINLLGNDQDIVDDTKIDINMLADIVAASGASVDSFEALFGKKETHEKTLVDIGILRFPDFENPFVKVYRIKLTAWSDCSRVLFVQDDKNGITGEFNSIKYKPRESVISELKQETKKKAVAEAEALFD
ncbi:hypothetical protein QUB47_01525 [Microcoleus sp. AT9_B5]